MAFMEKYLKRGQKLLLSNHTDNNSFVNCSKKWENNKDMHIYVSLSHINDTVKYKSFFNVGTL